jgi:hypothetical protein
MMVILSLSGSRSGESGGAVVECRPHDQEVVGSIPGQVTT